MAHMSRMERRETIIAFIHQALKAENFPDFDIEAGELLAYLDSVLLLQLVLFIEERFNIVLDMATFDLENFRTIDTLLEALEKAD
jgi:acyl carrier protein